MRQFLICVVLLSMISCDNAGKKKILASIQSLPALQVLLMDSTTLLNIKEMELPGSLVLVYFSTTCPSCNKEAQNIVGNLPAFGKTRFLFISPSAPSEIKEYAERFKLTHHPNIMVASDFQNAFRDQYKPRATPYTAIYGPDKKLIKIYHAAASFESLQKATMDAPHPALTQN